MLVFGGSKEQATIYFLFISSRLLRSILKLVSKFSNGKQFGGQVGCEVVGISYLILKIKRRRIALIAAGVVGSSFIVLALGIFWWRICSRAKSGREKVKGGTQGVKGDTQRQ
ncbi:hypothetical protein L1049_010743 [Liquidambar formosana]|uniref:Transmembrane protein n=1 Tax=Liquidambar formosana TaxID=63359 RepID=A0AAP0N883_LIQFO